MFTSLVKRAVLFGPLWAATLMALDVSHAQSGVTSPSFEVTPSDEKTPESADQLTIKVMQKGSGIPIGRAEVTIGTSGTDKAFTKPDGTVTVPRPADTIRINRFGWQEVVLRQEDIIGKKDIQVYLPPALGGDDTIIISGRRRPAVSRQVISVEEAAKVAPGGDPGQITKVLPGVQTSAFQSEVSIRGSAPGDTKYFIDDLEVPFVYHAIGQVTVAPLALISDVEFSAGGFGAEYGEATGGVITVRTKTEVPERAVTKFQVNVPLFSGIWHERPLKNGWGLGLSYRRSYLDAVIKAVLPPDSGTTVVPYFNDAFIVLTNKRDDGHDKITIMNAGDGLKAIAPGDFSIDEDGRGRFDLYTYYGVLGWERQHRLNSEWSYKSTPQLGYFRFKVDVVDNLFRLKVWQLRMPTELTWRPNRDDRVYFGLDPLVSTASVEFVAPRFDPNDPFFDFEEAPKVRGEQDVTVKSLSSWVAMDKKLGLFTVTPGLRAFNNDLTKKADVDPRLTVLAQVQADSMLKMAVGQYSKSAEPGETSASFGNTSLDFERANHHVLGIETRWGDRWSTDFQVFHKRAYRLVRTDPDPSVRYNNNGSLRSTGAEMFIRRNLTTRFFGWVSYAWSKTEERDSDDLPWYRGQYDQTHVLNMVGSWKATPIWDVGGRFKYNTGDTYTPRIGNAVYNSTFDKYQARGSADLQKNSKRLPPYKELAIYGERDSLWDTWNLTWRFGVEYLWLTRQVFQVQTNYDYSKEEFFRGVPPIPYLEVRGEF